MGSIIDDEDFNSNDEIRACFYAVKELRRTFGEHLIQISEISGLEIAPHLKAVIPSSEELERISIEKQKKTRKQEEIWRQERIRRTKEINL